MLILSGQILFPGYFTLLLVIFQLIFSVQPMHTTATPKFVPKFSPNIFLTR